MRVALYQPDIPHNTGAIIRLCACFGVPLDIIEPCGFLFDPKRLKPTALDYLPLVSVTRHHSWSAFIQPQQEPRRVVLLSTKAAQPYQEFAFQSGDTLLLGRESAGVPDDVHAALPHRVVIPLAPQARSLNVAQAAAIVLAEALRQTGGLPMHKG